MTSEQKNEMSEAIKEKRKPGRSTKIAIDTAAGVIALSPQRVSDMRAKIANKVTKHLEIADKVIKGEVSWSPTQARVFATLINKVIPDLTASYNQHEHNHKNISELSRTELEAIAAGTNEIAEGEVVDETKKSGSK